MKVAESLACAATGRLVVIFVPGVLISGRGHQRRRYGLAQIGFRRRRCRSLFCRSPREHDGLFHCAFFAFGSCFIAMGVVCSRPAHCCGAGVSRTSNLTETSRCKGWSGILCGLSIEKRNSSQQRARILSDVASDRDDRDRDVCAHNRNS